MGKFNFLQSIKSNHTVMNFDIKKIVGQLAIVVAGVLLANEVSKAMSKPAAPAPMVSE